MHEVDRAILLANVEFSKPAQEILGRSLPVELELLNFDSLRAWVSRIERVQEQDVSPVALAVTELSKALARLVAQNPRYLDEVEWRDMERMLATIFGELGFDVELTPPAKDGGKDIVLRCSVQGEVKKYLVEVKHWRSGKGIGNELIRQFVHVVAAEAADHGIYIATYEYAYNAIEALTEVERQHIRFGEEPKVVSLCRTFTRVESALWSPPTALPELLFNGTQ